MDESDFKEQLVSLGLTRYEAAVYLALLERQDCAPPQIAARAAVPRQRIYDTLASLLDRGLCAEGHSGQRTLFRAVDPAVALPALLAERERQWEEESARRRTQANTLAEALAPLFAAGGDADDPLANIEVIAQSSRIADRAAALAAKAEREIRVCFKRPSIISDDDNRRLVQEPLGRGVAYRAIYEKQILRDPLSLALVRQCVAWGQQARFVTEIPVKMQLHDGDVALLSLQDTPGDTPRFTAIAITNRGLARMLGLAFEALWEQAEEIAELGAASEE
ncbi:TrmB family transcriptional regulator [Capsulimonas corticalis]|uniref:TrmB family transcriptional regulator n=1 Tax=Capsulimonas corticalis TaxID=2219043 RepID=A0A402CNN6_9BACT|nr:helix-turn-helix domain-containing protein [Capsulimonas corticalis]BDI33287.1 TrmB family transcriptional regulator [Capsulimonas corticalis]